MRQLSSNFEYIASFKKWLGQCRIASTFEEVDTTIPPTIEEIEFLIQYLRQNGIDPLIVGSAAVLKHLGPDTTFRPTHDVDIYVNKKLPTIPLDWKVDTKSPGVVSWISPSGGYVDFLFSGHTFPTGEKLSLISPEEETKEMNLSYADMYSIFRLKLNSSREKDLQDLMALSYKLGRVPTEKDLGKLNQTQLENLELINLWLTNRLKREKNK